jgi:hypothetical protein
MSKKPEPYNPAKERVDATRRMLADPESWPHWPRLPMKRPGHAHEKDGIGTMLAFRTPPFRIYLTEMFATEITSAESLTFNSVDDLIDAGWTVD